MPKEVKKKLSNSIAMDFLSFNQN